MDFFHHTLITVQYGVGERLHHKQMLLMSPSSQAPIGYKNIVLTKNSGCFSKTQNELPFHTSLFSSDAIIILNIFLKETRSVQLELQLL